jgi:hypothetical protein
VRAVLAERALVARRGVDEAVALHFVLALEAYRGARAAVDGAEVRAVEGVDCCVGAVFCRG